MADDPAREGADKAFEGRDTQEEARAQGPHGADPDAPEAPPEGVGESVNESAEDLANRTGTSTAGHKGEARRPYGGDGDAAGASRGD